MTADRTTYDGREISDVPPFGVTIVVYRRNVRGLEYLVLHRALYDADYQGDWAWTPPAGARWPNEPPDNCAMRELKEETGQMLPMRRTGHGTTDWFVYIAEATLDTAIKLDAEHDRYVAIGGAGLIGHIDSV